ncbi:MAG: AAA family ATPase [Muribaculaceae bacterium]|nr:AAA family ATPase [Muribaculaceae bacterium]
MSGNDAIKALTEQRRLLLLEYEDEKKSYSTITERVGIHRLAERGDAWLDIRIGRVYYNSLNQRILEVFRDSANDDDHHFEYGRQVAFIITEGDAGSKPQIAFTGSVSFADGERMAVVISDSALVSRLHDAFSIAVMLSFDETTYRAMFEAIDRCINAKGRLAELRDILYSKRKVSELSLSPMRFPYLNRSQEEGVNKVLRAKDVAIVHGPPGTGKTTTLVEAINETLRRESQVMVCAQSNMAVDWISEKLVDRGIHVLRIGNPAKVNDKMLSFTYEHKFEAHPDYPTLWSIRKAIRELQGVKRKGTDQWHQKMDRLRGRATELEIRINNDLFNTAHVIACTLTGSANRILSGMKFTTLFIDEAAQALEAASLIPMRRAGRVILAGDHCQLPPTVKCFEAMKQGLGRSLMERLVDNHPEAVTLLTTQYRMNDEIMKFSSDWFYKGEMKASEEARYRSILDFDTPIEWIDTAEMITEISNECSDSDDIRAYRDVLSGNSFGRINKEEAQLTMLTLQNYINKIGKERFLDERLDIGLISPYRAQVNYLRHLLKRLTFFKPFRHSISVNTVDGFQGQERDIIVISLVRSNERGEIGFLSDLRRMNVAMTRARMKLLIIGDSSTLCRHPFYRKLKGYIESL